MGLNKKIIHDHHVSYEDEARAGKNHIEKMSDDEGDELFKKAKEDTVVNFKDSSGSRYKLVYQGSPEGYGRYLILRDGREDSTWL